MKYTFEIMKEYEDAFKGISVYSVSEDKKLMVDFVALEELEDAQKEIDEAYQRGLEEGKKATWGLVADASSTEYQRGLNEAWEAARKISLMSPDEIEKVFPGAAKYNRYNLGYSGVEVIERLKAYEEKQKADDEIKAGDVVRLCRHTVPYIVTSCDGDDDTYILMTVNGGFIKAGKDNDVHKTGRHFDIDKILEEMKE